MRAQYAGERASLYALEVVIVDIVAILLQLIFLLLLFLKSLVCEIRLHDDRNERQDDNCDAKALQGVKGHLVHRDVKNETKRAFQIEEGRHTRDSVVAEASHLC